jgi:hypothetical protein
MSDRTDGRVRRRARWAPPPGHRIHAESTLGYEEASVGHRPRTLPTMMMTCHSRCKLTERAERVINAESVFSKEKHFMVSVILMGNVGWYWVMVCLPRESVGFTRERHSIPYSDYTLLHVPGEGVQCSTSLNNVHRTNQTNCIGLRNIVMDVEKLEALAARRGPKKKKSSGPTTSTGSGPGGSTRSSEKTIISKLKHIDVKQPGPIDDSEWTKDHPKVLEAPSLTDFMGEGKRVYEGKFPADGMCRVVFQVGKYRICNDTPLYKATRSISVWSDLDVQRPVFATKNMTAMAAKKVIEAYGLMGERDDACIAAAWVQVDGEVVWMFGCSSLALVFFVTWLGWEVPKSPLIHEAKVVAKMPDVSHLCPKGMKLLAGKGGVTMELAGCTERICSMPL